MVEADRADLVPALAARIRLPDPEPRLAVGPADHVGVLVQHLEAEEREQPAVEFLGFIVIADANGEMVDADDAHHAMFLLCRRRLEPERNRARSISSFPTRTVPTWTR